MIRIGTLLCLLLAVWAMAASNMRGQKKRYSWDTPTHPLDPLTAPEINRATRVLENAGKLGPQAEVVWLYLQEPPKAQVIAYTPGDSLERRAFAVLYDRRTNTTAEALIDLPTRRLLQWEIVPDAQPGYLASDRLIADALVRADARWQAAISRRGIENPDSLWVLSAPPGAYEQGKTDGDRRAVVLTAFQDSGCYGGLVEGVISHVNLTQNRVERVEDDSVAVARRPKKHLFGEQVYERPTPDALRWRRLAPADTSIHLEGHQVCWKNWRFRLGFHPRVGLVLYTVGFEQQGRVRPILYRGAISEMVVPYGDPSWLRWNIFDAGYMGLGKYGVSPLVRHADAPDNAVYLNAAIHDEQGICGYLSTGYGSVRTLRRYALTPRVERSTGDSTGVGLLCAYR
jgi:primary-amine oxidase